MPKMKTHRGAAKRFRRTARGRFKHQRSNRGHLNEKKTGKRMRRLRQPAVLGAADTRTVRKLLPYQ
ncbi:50S ribosomal protein L35 [Thermaerobacter sp. PB12/4term]|uniref:50S ribosomal protein L35 n=1 Tax=Thermaerobacter sp. PB12/4term TaxID=2293838 RepID=UPI000E32C35C|nr:50S ribosomal protein L35 [Thermaerobacter sp. PB12/4term]QIA26811.1 50S ribosomal protein L35 [Thermaerobacter sp. PB12/4term]